MRGPGVGFTRSDASRERAGNEAIDLWNSLPKRMPGCHERAPIQVRDVREALLEGYCSDELLLYLTQEGDFGDTLAKFVTNEYDEIIGSAGDDDFVEREDLTQLILRIDTAEQQLHGVTEALRRLES